MSTLVAHSKTTYRHVACHYTVEAPCFRQHGGGGIGKIKKLCDFVTTTLQTRSTGARCGHSQRGLQARRSVRIP